MVAKQDPPYRLPDTPQPIGRLVESSLALWRASWRATLPFALLYGLASLLPALTLGDLVMRLVRESLGLVLRETMPWLPLTPPTDPLKLIEAMLAWVRAPQTWIVLMASTLLMLAALSLVIHRQHGVALGAAGGAAAWRAALARLPAGLGAWLMYLLAMLLCTLPLLLLFVLCLRWSLQVDLGGLLALLALMLVGGVLCSLPLAWLSVAAGFAPFASAMEGAGPIEAQRRSIRLVRGHWVHAAIVFTLPLLIYLGVASLVSSLLLGLCLALAWNLGGWPALLQGGWLGWSQWLALLPMAAVLPIATAGGVVALHDLRLRAAGR